MPETGPGDVSISTSASTRSGAPSTTRRATMPPIEWPRSRNPSNPTRVGHLQDVGGEPVERVGRHRVGRVARTVAAVVEGHHPRPSGERRDVVREVLLRAPEAVHEDQTRSVALDPDLEPHSVVGRHPHCLLPVGRSLPATMLADAGPRGQQPAPGEP